jgi:DNA-binding protein YbaB
METPASTNAALRARLDELLGQYDRLRKNLTAAQHRMRTMSGTAESPDHSVKVSVDSRGTLTGLELTPTAYRRYSPTLLAELILKLVKEASADVTSEMASVMAAFLPRDVSYADLVSGQTDLSAVGTSTLLTNETFDQWRARFSGHESVEVEEDT